MVKNSIVLTLAGATYPLPDTARVDDAKTALPRTAADASPNLIELPIDCIFTYSHTLVFAGAI